MNAFIIRIRSDAIRIPLLVLYFPIDFAAYLLTCAMPARLGGHPDKSRFLCRDFYAMPISVFWAAWDGYFVGMKGSK